MKKELLRLFVFSVMACLLCPVWADNQQLAPMVKTLISPATRTLNNASVLPPAGNMGAVGASDQRIDRAETDISRSVDTLQQDVNQRFTNLRQQNAILQSQLASVQAQIASVSQALQRLHVEQTRSPDFMQRLHIRLGDVGFDVFFGTLIFLLVLAIYFLWPRGRQSKSVKTVSQKVGADDEEYDYLGSRESIPAKLDLARAYIDMDDRENARIILNTVIQQGDETQKSDAKALLETLSKSKALIL